MAATLTSAADQSQPTLDNGNRYLIVLNEIFVLKGLKPNGHKDASISRYQLVSTKLSRDITYRIIRDLIQRYSHFR